MKNLTKKDFALWDKCFPSKDGELQILEIVLRNNFNRYTKGLKSNDPEYKKYLTRYKNNFKLYLVEKILESNLKTDNPKAFVLEFKGFLVVEPMTNYLYKKANANPFSPQLSAKDIKVYHACLGEKPFDSNLWDAANHLCEQSYKAGGNTLALKIALYETMPSKIENLQSVFDDLKSIDKNSLSYETQKAIESFFKNSQFDYKPFCPHLSPAKSYITENPSLDITINCNSIMSIYALEDMAYIKKVINILQTLVINIDNKPILIIDLETNTKDHPFNFFLSAQFQTLEDKETFKQYIEVGLHEIFSNPPDLSIDINPLFKAAFTQHMLENNLQPKTKTIKKPKI